VASGSIKQFTIPTPNSEPWDVAIGQDGTVWFTERAGNKIGKLVPATGQIVEYPVPSPNAQPRSLGVWGTSVWFTEAGVGKLGWFSTRTLEIQELPPPTSNSFPQDLALGAAGNPWLTEMQGNKIATFRASTFQDFLEIDVTTANSEPFGITVQGEEAVWFTLRAANKLGRFGGGLPPVEFPLPTQNSAPTGIAVDGSGCAWYTAPGANRIGRFCTYPTYLPITTRN
jgi:virginiamycin B lyase